MTEEERNLLDRAELAQAWRVVVYREGLLLATATVVGTYTEAKEMARAMTDTAQVGEPTSRHDHTVRVERGKQPRGARR